MKAIGRIFSAALMILAFLAMGISVAMFLKEGLFNPRMNDVQLTEMKNLAAQSPAIAEEFGSKIQAFAQAQSQVRAFSYTVIAIGVLGLTVVVLSFMKRFKPLIITAVLGLAAGIAAIALYPSKIGNDLDDLKAITMFYAIMAPLGLAMAKLSTPSAKMSE